MYISYNRGLDTLLGLLWFCSWSNSGIHMCKQFQFTADHSFVCPYYVNHWHIHTVLYTPWIQNWLKVTVGREASHKNLYIKPVLLNTTNAASAKIVTCLTSEGHSKAYFNFENTQYHLHYKVMQFLSSRRSKYLRKSSFYGYNRHGVISMQCHHFIWQLPGATIH